MLEGLYRPDGRAENATRPRRRASSLNSCPAQVVTATALFADGSWRPPGAADPRVPAEARPHVEAMRLLARIGIERDVP
jgi:hypothetical protein